MRLLLDANVVIAALTAQGLCHELLAEHTIRHVLLTSPQLQTDIEDKLHTKFHVDARQLVFYRLYQQRAENFTDAPALSSRVCRDPDDDHILAVAVAGQADVIVTGDQDLLVLKTYRGIPIVTPRQFLVAVG